MIRLRVVAVLVVAALLAIGCRADGPTLVELPPEPEGAGVGELNLDTQVEADDPEPLVVPTEFSFDLSALPDGPLTEARADEVIAFFDQFLSVRDRYWVGEASQEEFAAWIIDRTMLVEAGEYRAEYVKLLADDSVIATKNFASFSNGRNVRVERGDVVFDDCTEQQSLSALDFVGFRWIDQTVSIGQVDGRLVVRQLDVRHDGQPFSGEYGCAPPSFHERALQMAQQFMDESQRYTRSPGDVGADSFAMVDDENTRLALIQEFEAQRDAGATIDAEPILEYQVLGVNVAASLIDWLVGVEVCMTYPEGMVPTVDGEPHTEQVLAPGESLSLVVIASLDEVELGAPADDAVRVVVPGEIGCNQN